MNKELIQMSLNEVAELLFSYKKDGRRDIVEATVQKYKNYPGDEFNYEEIQSLFYETVAYVINKVKNDRILKKVVENDSHSCFECDKVFSLNDSHAVCPDCGHDNTDELRMNLKPIESVEHMQKYFYMSYWQRVTKFYKHCKKNLHESISDQINESCTYSHIDNFSYKEGINSLNIEESLILREDILKAVERIEKILKPEELELYKSFLEGNKIKGNSKETRGLRSKIQKIKGKTREAIAHMGENNEKAA